MRSTLVKNLSLTGMVFLVFHALAFAQVTERLSLQDAISIALRQNPEVASASRGVDIARGRFWQGISPPPASLSVGYDYIPNGRGVNDYGERAITISQSLEFPTTIYLRGSSLSSETRAAEADYRSREVEIVTRVKLAYFDALAKREQVKLAVRNLTIAEDFARKAEIRLNVGEGTNLERLTAAVERTQAINALEVARNELQQNMGVLHTLLGQRRDQTVTEFSLTDSLQYRPLTVLLGPLMDSGNRLNPRVQAAEFRARAASINRSIAWSSILPDLTVSYSRQAQLGTPNLYGVSFGISLPIWFLLDQRGQIQTASATHSQLEADLRSEQNAVHLETRNAFLALKNDEREVQLYETSLLHQSEEAYRVARMSYEAGEISYIEYLRAQQVVNGVKNSYIDALLRYNTSLARLEYAVGDSLTD